MTIPPTDLAAALTDVRKAYRFIHAYQQRVWDLLRTVDHTLALAGLQFQSWAPTEFDSPPKRKTRFFVERWAWDFLPAYNFGCEWQAKGTSAAPTRHVFVIVAADSGYENLTQEEPDPSEFQEAELSATTIHLGSHHHPERPCGARRARRAARSHVERGDRAAAERELD